MLALLPGFREKGFFMGWEFCVEMREKIVRGCVFNCGNY